MEHVELTEGSVMLSGAMGNIRIKRGILKMDVAAILDDNPGIMEQLAKLEDHDVHVALIPSQTELPIDFEEDGDDTNKSETPRRPRGNHVDGCDGGPDCECEDLMDEQD